MAKIKEPSKRGITTVFEDDRPSNNWIYMDGYGHNKTTLAPVFNAEACFQVSNSDPSNHQVSAYTNMGAGDSAYHSYTFQAGFPGSMLLTKQTAYDNKFQGTGNDGRNNVITYHMRSLDPDNPVVDNKRFIDTNGLTHTIKNYNSYPRYCAYRFDHDIGRNDDTYYHQRGPGVTSLSYGGTTSNNTIIDRPMAPVSLGDNDTRIAFITSEWRTSYFNYPYEGYGYVDYDDPATSPNMNIGQRTNTKVQYIGRSTQDDKPIFLANSILNEYTQYIDKFNVGSANVTTLHTFNAAPTTVNTLYGGARGYTTIGKTNNYASTWFSKYNDSDTKVFYVPYFDANYDYHPFVFEWDTTTDTFTRGQADNIAVDSSTHISGHTGMYNNNAADSSVMWNETFVNSGNRYLTLMAMHTDYSAGGTHDATATARTFISYSVSGTDATALTYHSKVEIPKTPRNVIFLNDARTIMGVICFDVFYIYNWNNTNGWVKTGTIPGKFYGVGRDSTDRIWAIQGDQGQYMNTHIITPTTPISITVTPASATYNYTGTTINSTIDVSAYDIQGNRIATNVALTIDGSTMTFGDDTTSATVTTSTSAETSQAIKITGAGLSDIVANVSL